VIIVALASGGLVRMAVIDQFLLNVRCW